MPATRPFFAILGWLTLAVIVASTLSPIGLRPESGFPANDERFMAFAALSSLFILAYPARWKPILLVAIALAGLLEAGQHLVPDRHGTLHDFSVKILGAFAGTLGALALDTLLRRLKPRLRPKAS